jgi:hypothetical protein
VRDRHRGGWRRSPGEEDEDNATWRLMWVIAGATTFTVIMFLLDLI